MRAMRPVAGAADGSLELVEVERPRPGEGEVLVRVHRAGVNFSDVVGHRTGINRFTGAPIEPGEIPGGEVAGIREDTGERVVALCEDGGYAEWATAPAAFVHPIPEEIGYEDALGLFVSGLTAWFLYRRFARPAGGETVVVPGAGGAVGSLAVQLGKTMGAGRVIAAASTAERRALALELGADAAVDSAVEGLTERLLAANGGEPVDVVFDMAGGAAFDAGLAALGPLGRLVAFGTASGTGGAVDTRALIPGSRAVLGMWLIDLLRRRHDAEEAWAGLCDLFARGSLRLLAGPAFGLAEAGAAQRELAGRRTSGKVVLDLEALA
jgi:NADPH2:quinone reductase